MTPQEMQIKLETKYPQSTIKVYSNDNVHFEVSIESSAFQGLSRIEQHQQVMQVFDPELKTGEVHALSIKTKAL
jgi:stress-induced morphogen